MRDDDDKTLLTVATLAVGALTAFGAFMALTDRVEKAASPIRRTYMGSVRMCLNFRKSIPLLSWEGRTIPCM